MITSTIYKLYPNVVRTVGDVAYDADGNEVTYDLAAVIAQSETDAQTQEDAKQAAQTKLAKLGLTPDDLKALLG